MTRCATMLRHVLRHSSGFPEDLDSMPRDAEARCALRASVILYGWLGVSVAFGLHGWLAALGYVNFWYFLAIVL